MFPSQLKELTRCACNQMNNDSRPAMSQHILFVDDEVPIRETLSLYFKAKGIKVTTAENGQQALQLSEQIPFNLIILDLRLGQENGLELLTQFKALYPARPVIMFSSVDHDPELLEEAHKKGAHAFMSKTEPLENLVKEVRKALLVPGSK